MQSVTSVVQWFVVQDWKQKLHMQNDSSANEQLNS